MWANMRARFKSFPMGVRVAIVFIIVALTTAMIIAPSITFPLVIVLGTILSFLRIAFYVIEKK